MACVRCHLYDDGNALEGLSNYFADENGGLKVKTTEIEP